jgi:hypothetical protein
VATWEQLPFGPGLDQAEDQHDGVVLNAAGIPLLPKTVRTLFWTPFVAVFLWAAPIPAQQSPASPEAVPSVQEQFEAKSNPSDELAAPILQVAPKTDRLFYVLPNYLTVENLEQADPLAAKTKFQLSAKTMSDPVTISFLGMIALIGQARNSNPSYGQGLKGYGKRYATVFADTGIGTVMTTSVFPTLLKQDPRYFQLGRGGTWHRVVYSVSRIFVTRTDNAEVQFNYSEIFGNAVAAGLSNTYHPANQRTLGNTLSVWGTETMLNALCNVAKEFWPDIRRKLHRGKANLPQRCSSTPMDQCHAF